MSGGFEKWCFCLWTEQNASGFKIRIAVIHFREVIFKIDGGGTVLDYCGDRTGICEIRQG